jgi:hypothetical protein
MKLTGITLDCAVHMDIRNDREQIRQYIEEQFKTTTGKVLALERFMQK